MADIRINSLSTTASTTASDDYIAIDGSANGTRKLSAYSPTFGGNLTVSGTVSTANNVYFTGNQSLAAAGSIGVQAAAGLSMWPKTGVTYDFMLYDAAGNAALYLPTGTKNFTATGNLTVSGNTLTFGGGSTLTDNSAGGSTLSSVSGQDLTLNGGGNVWFQKANGSGFTWRNNAAGSYTSYMTLNGSGNLLLGTTTDSGQKLQVAGSAIFGSTNTAEISNPTGYIIRQTLSASSVGLRIESDSGNGCSVIGTTSNHPLILRTKDITALTLDSSQNATFAGNATVTRSNSGGGNYLKIQNSSNTANSGAFLNIQTGGTSGGSAAIEYYNGTTAFYAGLTTTFATYFLGTAANGSSPKFSLDTSSGDATFAGTVKAATRFFTGSGTVQTASASTTGVNIGFDANTEQGWIQATRNNSSETRNILINPLGGYVIFSVSEYADNAAATAAGLPGGAIYRTGDTLKIVH